MGCGILLQVQFPGNPTNLYVASRASTGVDFGTPALVTTVSPGGSFEFLPFVTADGG